MPNWLIEAIKLYLIGLGIGTGLFLAVGVLVRWDEWIAKTKGETK